MYTSTNKVLVVTAGVLLGAFMAWAFTKDRKSSNTAQGGKRGLWWLLVVFVALFLKVVFTPGLLHK